MKAKIFIVCAVMLCAVTARAFDYPYLVFTNTGGETTAIAVSNNMTLAVSGSTLAVTNDDGTTSFTLTDLSAMQFSTSDTLTALKNVLKGDEPVRVYSLNGVAMGTFDNLLQAVQRLSKGTYVIKQGSNSQTIVVQ